MYNFLSASQDNGRYEVLIDWTIFSTEVSLRAAYALLDTAYFFFKKDGDNTIVQIHAKNQNQQDSHAIALEYADELLATLLRIKVEQDNKVIRETIVRRALGSYADLPNFTAIPPVTPAIDFDKDIDAILRDIENDPELQISQEEIDRILNEIRLESQEFQKKPTIDINKIQNAKKQFQR